MLVAPSGSCPDPSVLETEVLAIIHQGAVVGGGIEPPAFLRPSKTT